MKSLEVVDLLEVLRILSEQGLKTLISMFSQGKIKREDFELAILTHMCTCLENMTNRLDTLSSKLDTLSNKLDVISNELKSIKDTLNFTSSRIERIEKILHNINENIVITYEQTVTILRKLMRISTE